MEQIGFLPPKSAVLSRRREIVGDLKDLLPEACLVHEPRELVPFETDAFVSYRRVPLAVALPETTAQVAAVLKYCHRYGIPVVPRGAGTSLSGGAIPQEDAVVLGLSKMSRILEVDYANRTATVQAGVTNLAISDAVSADGYFYAPDPSSQLACTIGGNIAMNSGGAHCLKYGVTTNNLLGVKMVLVDGTVIELGGKALDAPGLDLLGLVCGSEGQLGVVTEATVRLIAKPEGARPVLFGFDSSEEAGACVADIIGAGIIPVAIEFMDKPAIEICEAFAQAGYPMDVEALLIVEVEGSEAEMDGMLESIVAIARRHGVKVVKESQSATQAALIWKGRKSAFGATGRIADYICMDGTVPLSQLSNVLRGTAEIVARHGLRVANVFHAGDGNMHPLILFNANDPEDAARAEEAGN
ncbi:MAG TPA: FAD-binding protein, partial [Mycoplana sp.]|nr:FAD-binding protein [Mycoplana sp.]